MYFFEAAGGVEKIGSSLKPNHPFGFPESVKRCIIKLYTYCYINRKHLHSKGAQLESRAKVKF